MALEPLGYHELEEMIQSFQVGTKSTTRRPEAAPVARIIVLTANLFFSRLQLTVSTVSRTAETLPAAGSFSFISEARSDIAQYYRPSGMRGSQDGLP